MQGWKGKVRKNRLIRWFGGMEISKRYRILFIVIISYTIVWNGTNIYFDTFEIDNNSARYLLSALVQSQAAIIAIVVTMTLVAVQLTASAYSPRVIDIFKNDHVMWLLLVWYGLSMFFGLFVLEMTGSNYSNPNPWCIAVSLESCVFLAYLMGILAFAGLFWHVGNVITLLKPENIIKKLSGGITRESVLKFIRPEEKQNGNQTESAKNDPVQPIVDIIHGAVMKYDIATTRVGLKAITEKAIEVIHSDYEGETAGHFCAHLERIGKLTVSREDGESVIKVIESLDTFGKSTAEKGLERAAVRVAKSLGGVGTASAEKGLERAAMRAAKSLEVVGKAAAEKELERATLQVAGSLGDIGKASAEKELEYVASQAAGSLGVVGIFAAEEGLTDTTEHAVRSLGHVGKLAERNGLDGAVRQSLESLGRVGMTAAEKELRHAAATAASDLMFCGRFAIEKGNKGSAKRVIWFLEKIGTIVENGLDVAWQAAESLRLVGVDAIEKGKEFEDVTNEVICRLRSVGRYTEGAGLEKATKQVAQSFVWIGVLATENGLDGAAQEVAKSLAAISNKKLVAQAFRESESDLRAYGDYFQKFWNLYKHEFKKPVVY